MKDRKEAPISIDVFPVLTNGGGMQQRDEKREEPTLKLIRKCVFFSYRVFIIAVARPIPTFLHSLFFH